jgi:hypothetical protein
VLKQRKAHQNEGCGSFSSFGDDYGLMYKNDEARIKMRTSTVVADSDV